MLSLVFQIRCWPQGFNSKQDRRGPWVPGPVCFSKTADTAFNISHSLSQSLEVGEWYHRPDFSKEAAERLSCESLNSSEGSLISSTSVVTIPSCAS